MARSLLSPLGEIVRKHDPDRYLTALFAPAAHREALFALYAMNHELARAREAAREPFAALIRLQWWREVVDGARRRHAVAGPIGEVLDAGRLLAADLMGMIDAREAETEPMETVAAFEDYVHGAAGGVMVAAARLLGMPDPERVRGWGAAYGVAGVIGNMRALAGQDRCLLPADLLHAAGLTPAAVVAAPDGVAVQPVKQRLSRLALTWLEARPGVPSQAWAATLPSVLARRDLAAGRADALRTMADRFAVVLAGFRGPARGVSSRR